MLSSMRILQWNCRSIAPKLSEVTYLLNKNNVVVSAISESWLRPGSRFRVPGFACVRDDRDDGYGGCAILVKNNFIFSVVDLPAHSDSWNAVAVRVQDITYLSLYIPSPSPSLFNELSVILSSLSRPCIILGDFNSHHGAWGSHTNDTNGNLLLNLIDDHNLCILNSGSPTRRTSPAQQASVVDLSLCSPDLASLLEWDTLYSTHGSDHFPILIPYPRSTNNSYRKPAVKYKINEADWGKFNSIVFSKIKQSPQPSLENCTKDMESFSNFLICAGDEAVPLKSGYKRRLSPPWWDSDCTTAIKQRLKAEKTYNNDMSDTNYNILIGILEETKNLLKSKKAEGWRNYCNSISPSTPPTLVWKNIRRFRSASQDTRPTHFPIDLCNQFLDKLSPPSVPSLEELPISYAPFNSGNHLDKPFSMDELKSVLDHLKDSSPGLDGIPYSFICKCHNESLSYFLQTINFMFDTGNIPKSWRSQIIIPILKPHKDPNNPNSYRPIALSCTVAKVTEHLIKNRIEWHAEHHLLLGSSQYGFRKGRSALDNLSIFTTDVRLAFGRNESVLGAFLDVSSAYDNVSLPILRHKMHQLSFPEKLTNFMMNMFLDRCIHLRANGEIIGVRSAWKGLPQGSVLSPLLYNIYTSDLDHSVLNCKMLQYADDILIYHSDRDVQKCADSVNETLLSVKSWLNLHHLNLAPSKSRTVLFTRKRTHPMFTVSLDNIPVPKCAQIKFLGFILDSKLSGTPHVEHIVKKCEKNINILRALSGVWWGAHPYSLKLLYNALIRSHLDYCAFLLEPANKASLRRLDSIQYKALRIITGAMKSSPTSALQVECVDPPLYLRRQYLADRYLFRTILMSTHTLLPKLHLLLEQSQNHSYWRHKNTPCLINSIRKFQKIKDPTYQCSILPIFNTPFDIILFKPDIIFNLGIDKHTVDADREFQYQLNRYYPDFHYIYTDASKLNNHSCVGYAIFHKNWNIVQKKKCPPESSVYTGEILAILEAVKYCIMFKLQNCIIFSDSLSSLQSLVQNCFYTRSHNPITYQIKELLFQGLTLNLTIKLAWVPGHRGIQGNEAADILAKDAITCGDLVPYKNYSSDFQSIPNADLQLSWAKSWEENKTLKSYRYAKVQPTVPVKPWFFKTRFSKRVTSILCRMRLGHCLTRVFLHKIRIRDSSICECGLDDEDLNHILFSCPLLDHSFIFNSIYELKLTLPFDAFSILFLANNRCEVLRAIANFIEVNNIKL